MSNERKQRQTRSLPQRFETREAEGGALYIEGYFAVFDSPYELWEGAVEIVKPGAFAGCLRGTKLTPQEIRKVSLWIDLLVPQIGDYREANNWSDHDREFYDRYDKKRKQARMEEQENIRQYIQSLQTKQQK